MPLKRLPVRIPAPLKAGKSDKALDCLLMDWPSIMYSTSNVSGSSGGEELKAPLPMERLVICGCKFPTSLRLDGSTERQQGIKPDTMQHWSDTVTQHLNQWAFCSKKMWKKSLLKETAKQYDTNNPLLDSQQPTRTKKKSFFPLTLIPHLLSLSLP